MSSKTPNLTATRKTGRAQRMREWMQDQKKPWAAFNLCESLGIPRGTQRVRVRQDIANFVSRGEITIIRGTNLKSISQTVKRNRRQNYYLYSQCYQPTHRRGSNVRMRIYKAMYVAGTFSAADIMRLAGVPDRSFIYQIIRELSPAGYLSPVGVRSVTGQQPEAVHHIPNRDKFRLEVMR
jgi:hypothetical protein